MDPLCHPFKPLEVQKPFIKVVLVSQECASLQIDCHSSTRLVMERSWGQSCWRVHTWERIAHHPDLIEFPGRQRIKLWTCSRNHFCSCDTPSPECLPVCVARSLNRKHVCYLQSTFPVMFKHALPLWAATIKGRWKSNVWFRVSMISNDWLACTNHQICC